MIEPLEIQIAKELVRFFLDKGWTIDVNDGEETVLKNSADAGAIWGVMRSTGEDWLFVNRDDTKQSSWVRLIWGNGVDVISDHGVSIEPEIAEFCRDHISPDLL